LDWILILENSVISSSFAAYAKINVSSIGFVAVWTSPIRVQPPDRFRFYTFHLASIFIVPILFLNQLDKKTTVGGIISGILMSRHLLFSVVRACRQRLFYAILTNFFV
jgi:hypothetical protein